jgi:hypothetical protein
MYIPKSWNLEPRVQHSSPTILVIKRIFKRVQGIETPARNIKHEVLAELLHFFDSLIQDPN